MDTVKEMQNSRASDKGFVGPRVRANKKRTSAVLSELDRNLQRQI